MRSKLCLYFDSRIFFPFELFSFHVHFEFRLYFQGSLIISFPIFLCLIRTVIVQLYSVLHEGIRLVDQVHVNN